MRIKSCEVLPANVGSKALFSQRLFALNLVTRRLHFRVQSRCCTGQRTGAVLFSSLWPRCARHIDTAGLPSLLVLISLLFVSQAEGRGLEVNKSLRDCRLPPVGELQAGSSHGRGELSQCLPLLERGNGAIALCLCSTPPVCVEGIAPAHHTRPEVTSPLSWSETASASTQAQPASTRALQTPFLPPARGCLQCKEYNMQNKLTLKGYQEFPILRKMNTK